MTEIKRDIVRDLMRVAYAWADEPVCPVSGRSGALEIAIRDALRAALAKSQPVEQGEPVRPMSDEEREDAFSRLPNAKSGQFYYYLGIADAEAFHGIKGVTE